MLDQSALFDANYSVEVHTKTLIGYLPHTTNYQLPTTNCRLATNNEYITALLLSSYQACLSDKATDNYNATNYWQVRDQEWWYPLLSTIYPRPSTLDPLPSTPYPRP
jgi:hypothetical protein